MQTDFDAVIVGAGPAGSSAAILLAEAGWSVALVEKQAFPRRKVCGECIAASNLPLLAALGIGAEFEALAGSALRRVALMRGTRTAMADLPAAADPQRPWGRALGREALDTLLLERARDAGATVFQPWSVQAIGGGAGDYRCELRAVDAGNAAGASDALTLRARVLIAAHGSWEPLASSRETRRLRRRPGDLFAFKANFRGAALAEGLLPVLAFDGGYGGMVVADGGVTTLACCIRRDRLDACRRAAPGQRAGDVVEALLKRECSGVEAALRPARRDGAWLAAGPLDPGVRLAADDSHFRIGNAAGEAHPIIGEGISMAMQSAWLLCARLIAARPLEDVSDSEDLAAPDRDNAAAWHESAAWQRRVRSLYIADWRRHFTPRLRLAAAFAHVAMRPVASAALLGLLGLWPALLTRGAAWGGKARCAVDAATIGALAFDAAAADAARRGSAGASRLV